MHNVEIHRQPATEVLPTQRSATSILVVPGLPDHALPDNEKALYPANAIDLVKIAAEAGVTIEFADPRDRAYVGLKAAEVWLPILVFLEEALAAGLGVIIGDMLRELIGNVRERRAKLHMKLGKEQKEDETIEWMTASGDADEVLKAMDAFLGRPRNPSK